jgi:hypothetical protein
MNTPNGNPAAIVGAQTHDFRGAWSCRVALAPASGSKLIAFSIKAPHRNGTTTKERAPPQGRGSVQYPVNLHKGF